MKSLSSPQSSTVEQPGAVSQEVRSLITAFVLRWGTGLGMLVGAMTGGSIGWYIRNAVPGDQFGMIGIGLMVGVAAGFFLGLIISFVDALFLVRSVPDVVSGKTQASSAAATSAAVAAVGVIGVTLLLLSTVWHGAFGDIVVLAPAVVLTVVAWIAGNWVGERALNRVSGSTS
jgi:hypothetical protein